jgi:voltage-gated potassium channel
MRKRIYQIIEKAETNDFISKMYDIFMLVTIFASLVPITFKNPSALIIKLDYACAIIFVIDYILRWITADKRKGDKADFMKYPFTPMAIMDLLAILPTFTLLNPAFRVLKVVRVFRALRIFKALRYSNNFIMISNVIKKNASILLSLLICAFFYILVSALFIFSIEPESFNNFFDALYWATTALTTVGYGDIYPVTDAGKLISMISSFFGIAMVALPSGVITAGFIKEIESPSEVSERREEE